MFHYPWIYLTPVRQPHSLRYFGMVIHKGCKSVLLVASTVEHIGSGG